MPRRKRLKGIAHGLCGGFSSRNNDVDGYWALGLLFKVAMDSDTNSLRLNLITGESVPKSNISKIIAGRYFSFVLNQMNRQGLARDRLAHAEVVMTFNVPPTKHEIMYMLKWGDKFFKSVRGEPFLCEARLIDDRDKVWTAEFRGRCDLHDPTLETRNSRTYST